MNRAGYPGIALQQAVSFSPFLAKMNSSPALFWPGCALMQLDPALLLRTFAVLKRREPQLGLSSCCCGQPSCYLFPKTFQKSQQKLKTQLSSCGVQRIYTACPNCTIQLKKLGSVTVIPIWSTLNALLEPGDFVSIQGQSKEDVSTPSPNTKPLGNTNPPDLAFASNRVILHDPCPCRKDQETQMAVRELLKKAGYSVFEPDHSGLRTLCCGNYHMMQTTAPEKSRALLEKRLLEFPVGHVITSYCEGCLGSFRQGGRPTRHLLELLMGHFSQRNWLNRIQFSLKINGRKAPRYD